MKILIVIVNYNDSITTMQCIRSVLNSESSINVNVDICIVDNASNSKNKEILKNSIFNKCNIIYSNKNVGYFPGLNIGLKQYELSSFDYVIIGNNDIVLRKDFLLKLSKTKYKQDYYAISPDIINLDGLHQNPHEVTMIPKLRILMYRIYFLNFWFGSLMYKIQQLIKKIRNKDNRVTNWNSELEIFLGYGAIYILTKSFFLKNTELKYPFFLMGEEVYLSFQIYQTGGRLLYDPSLCVEHLEHSSVSSLKSKRMYEITKESFKGYVKLIKKIKY